MKQKRFEGYGEGEDWANLHPDWPRPRNPGVYSDEDAVMDPCIGVCPLCGDPFYEDSGRRVGNAEACAQCS